MRRLAAVGLIGLVAGYVSILGFPITTSLLVVALLLALRIRGWSGVEVGIFLAAAGAACTLVLGEVLLNASKCDYRPCVSESTTPTFVACVAIATIGAGTAVVAAYRRRHA